MSGGSSLGLRSGSNGSLQQLAQIQILPVSVRKTPNKMMLMQGSREKERVFLNRICKIAGRRRVGMLLLLVVSAAVFWSLFSFTTKDDHTTPGIGTVIPNPIRLHESVVNTNTKPMKTLIQKTQLIPVPIADPSQLFTEHPCANFSFTPPPLNPKRTGPRPCQVCYVSVQQAMSLIPISPTPSPVLNKLDFVSEENLVERESSTGGSVFGGYPSLLERDRSFHIKDSMNVHCGFVRGKRPGQNTGFDIDESDLFEMEQCNGVVVASAIFGNYDILQQPKNVSEESKRSVCFFMFVDEETEKYIRNYTSIDENKMVGLWRIIVVRNLPYQDARRNGKVPKLLLHRLFPNVRYSIWIDGKLELVRDPFQILERFLWRKNSTLAISRHYRRFDVFEEAEANKAAGKYDNASIDYQVEFYRREGLTHYSSSKLPITSDVPEGCVIIREHIPITNLFTCLWFNEVDRFTARDQLSFSTVRDKIRAQVAWFPNMFWDCERRDFVVQAYHRELWEQTQAALKSRPRPISSHEPLKKPVPKIVPEPKNRKLVLVKKNKRKHRSKNTILRDNSFLSL
ncbi:hypothetical protein LUZ60_008420 [Juncus effusus]|nr:hypothetical protein LUZ60_008420 [Juncus effusus]